MSDSFAAPAWLRGAHAQTVYAPLFRRIAPAERRRERLELPDGDFVDLDWVDPAHGPLVIILHGLGGSGDSVYVVGMQHALGAAGLGSVTMHFRGASGEPNRLPRSYHAGDTGDVAFLATTLRSRFPHRRLGLLGYSLGGNVALRYAAGNAVAVDAVCSVSAPLQLAPCSARLDRGFSRVYRDRLLRELLGNLARKRQQFTAAGRREDAARLHAIGDLATIRSFREFDERVIAPLHGFRNADDYYVRCSAGAVLRDIRIPARIIHAVDDPFMTPDIVPATTDVSPTVTLSVSAHGGHVGFVHGLPWRPRWWLEETIPGWLAAALCQASRAGGTSSSDAAMMLSGPGAPGAR